MDPNETLRKIRKLFRESRELPRYAVGTNELVAFWREHNDKTAELFEALDAWLSAGGFNPSDWGGFDHSDCEICQEDIDLDSLESRDIPNYADPADTVDDGS